MPCEENLDSSRQKYSIDPECGQQSEGKLFTEGIVCFMVSHNLLEFVSIHRAGKENVQNYYAHTLKDWLPRLEKTYKRRPLTF